MDIKQIAAVLLVMRLVSVLFMLLVIGKQRKLNKLPVRPGLEDFRTNLNRLTMSILVANIVPIAIDIMTMLSPTGLHREDSPSTWGIVYAFSNATSSILQSVFAWQIYRQAESIVVDE